MRPWTPEYAGRIDERVIDSVALRGNALGDDASRPLWVYLPPGYDDAPDRRYPTVYFLQGYGDALPRWSRRPLFGRTTPELVDAVFADDAVARCIVVYVDAWTSLGGSQFVDSPGTGRYQTYLCEDVVGFVDANYRTLSSPKNRALQGHSSGGFGAIVGCMMRPDVFGAFASHAGDVCYEHCYLPEIATSYRALRDRYERSYARFFEDLARRGSLSCQDDFSLAMVYAVAACFSAEEDGSVRLPFDPASGRINEDIWERWLAWDPIRMVSRYTDALRSLRAIWIDAGKSDEYCFDVGAEILVEELRRVGVSDLAFELFDGGHGGMEQRYPLGLRYLAERIAPR